MQKGEKHPVKKGKNPVDFFNKKKVLSSCPSVQAGINQYSSLVLNLFQY